MLAAGFVPVKRGRGSSVQARAGRSAPKRALAFYDFPAEHWQHLRTSNPIESTFATVRLRTYRTKGHPTRLSIDIALNHLQHVLLSRRTFEGDKKTSVVAGSRMIPMERF